MKAIPTWKQRKLQDVLTVNSGSDYKHLETGEIPVYGTGGYMLSVNDNLSKSDSIGIGRKGTIDKPQYLKAPFWTVDTLFFMTPFKNFDINFLFALSQKINWKRMDQSTGVPSLSKVVIEKTMEYFPSLGEQQSIGFLFRQFDKAIILHQEKLSKLQSLKKAALQSLFPQKDETEPKVRFANFKSKWSQRQLGETLIERNIQQTQSIEYPLVSFTVQDGVTPKTERYNRQQLVRGSKKDKKYKVTEFNDIVYNPANLKFGAIARNKYGKAVL
ncbi:MAG: restriction endonuclease subunit S, partial [Tetragenococcus koreensis]|nr:restriction endonuclease subunit S [Tetragenococcus koreensis]